MSAVTTLLDADRLSRAKTPYTVRRVPRSTMATNERLADRHRRRFFSRRAAVPAALRSQTHLAWRQSHDALEGAAERRLGPAADPVSLSGGDVGGGEKKQDKIYSLTIFFLDIFDLLMKFD